MKIFLIITAISFAGCENPPDGARVEEIRLQAKHQMEEKVNDVVKQLREDCDSSIMQAARMLADSIRNKAKPFNKNIESN